MDILKELWYGNVLPAERPVEKGSDYARARAKAMDETEALLVGLSPELRQAVEQVVDSHLEAAVLAERDAFVQGFQLAVQILAACGFSA